ncbi:MAG: hypothetical protein AAF557_25420 [Pseudomonadota bacterium]
MSFFRPEAVDAVRRYAEPVLYTVIAVAGLWRGTQLIREGAWVGAVLFTIGAFAAIALVTAIERAIVAWRGRRRGPGIVSIREGQISYFGPEGGAILAMDALVRVEIITTETGPFAPDLFWHLTDEIGQTAVIPGGAEDITTLLDRLGSLPGFDHIAVISAMGSTEQARFKIWSRPKAGQLGG